MLREKLYAKAVHTAGKVPWISTWLRKKAGAFEDGSIVRIRTGLAAGMLWKRDHRYVNGYWLGHYELPLQRVLASHLREGSVFYDVGANAGFFSLLAAKLVGAQGHVYAFEPMPDNVKTISEQFRLNELGQCTLSTDAVAAQIGTARFSSDPAANSVGHLGSPQGAQEMSYDVRTTTLDVFAAINGLPDLVKIDVEGFESEVLKGAATLIQNGVPFLIELHGAEPSAAVSELLSAAGYEFFDIEGKPLRMPISAKHVIAKKPKY